VASSGGHLAQLHVLRQCWAGHARHWVTFNSSQARDLLDGEEVSWAHHPTTRNIPNLLRNFVMAFRTMRRCRPDVVVSTGAGVAVPFFVLAKLFGARTAYLEVYDRVTTPTMTGRICAPLADLFLLQWPEQKAVYPRGVVVGPVF
jgi:UDP-N-acetylglucosamine:LPS N-acetylglucosamine transferase